MRRHILRAVTALMLCAAALAGLTACGGGADAVPLGDEPVFTIAVTELPDSLNPVTSSGKLAEEFFLLVYDPLWRINADGEPVNCLVEGWDLSSDQLTWTIRLRRDVTFSDGTPLTSEDVRFSYEMLQRSSDRYAHYFDGISDILCPDDYTVIITTSYIKGDMQYNPAPVLPQHIWRAYEYSMDEFVNEEMIGSGPFVYAPSEDGEERQNTVWTFRAREDYFGGSARLGQVRFVYYGTETGVARALSAGEADAGIGMTDMQLTTLQEVPGVELIQAVLPKTDVWAIAFNTRTEPFENTAMRQMVEYCTDREWILSMSSGQTGISGSVWASPGTEYFAQITDLRSFDQDAARSILAGAGYGDIDQDGYLENMGTEERLRLRLYTSDQDSWAATAATVLQEDLAEIGVEVVWDTADGPIEEVCGPQDNWDMCMVTWTGNADPVIGAMPFTSSSDSLTGWSSDIYDQLFSQLRVATDFAEMKSLTGQLQQLVYDECPYVIVGYRSDVQAIRNDAWIGYEDVLAAAGGLFGTGSVDAYMSIEPADAIE